MQRFNPAHGTGLSLPATRSSIYRLPVPLVSGIGAGTGIVGDMLELLESVEPIGALLPIDGAGALMPLLGAGVSVEGVAMGAGAGTTLVSSTFLLQAPRASSAVNATEVAARVLNFDVNIGVSFCENKQAAKATPISHAPIYPIPTYSPRDTALPACRTLPRTPRLVARCNHCHFLMRQSADDRHQTDAHQQPGDLRGGLGQRGALL